jgi:hypothetical protein
MQRTMFFIIRCVGYFDPSIGRTLLKTAGLVNIINQNNYTFITIKIDGIELQTYSLFLLLKKWEKVRFGFDGI